jgi:LysR family glycine cleavage system transcriptional activator
MLGEAAWVEVGAGDWIAWPGDALPGGEETPSAVMLGSAGEALAAARAGLGRARVPALLVGEGRAEPCRRAYWLVAPLPQWRQKKVKALVSFLTQ